MGEGLCLPPQKLRTAPFELWVMQRTWLQNKSLFLLKETIGSLENPSDESQMVSWPLTPPPPPPPPPPSPPAPPLTSIALSTFASRFFPIEQKHVLPGRAKSFFLRGRARHLVVPERKVTLWETDAAEWGGTTSGARRVQSHYLRAFLSLAVKFQFSSLSEYKLHMKLAAQDGTPWLFMLEW